MMEHRLSQNRPKRCVGKVIGGLLGASLVCSILYFVGDGIWETTHLRMSYLTTETYNLTCWKIKRLITTHESDQDNHTHIRQLVSMVNVSERWPGFSEEPYSPGGGILEDMTTENGKLLMYWLTLQQQETREVKRNWIQVYGRGPEWYYTQTCVSELDVLYWKEEVVEPAPFMKNTCHQLIPAPRGFMGGLELTCSYTEPPPTMDGENDEKQAVNQSGRQILGIYPWKPPRMVRKPTTRLLKDKAFKLDACLWGLGPVGCKTTSYYPLILTSEGNSNLYYKEWVNESLPWVWKREVAHLRFSKHTWKPMSADNLLGPEHTEMYVQKLPTPDDLWSAPKGDFAKIDECAVNRLFSELDNTDFTAGGGTKYDWVSPRCEINQVGIWESGYWTYDCSRFKNHRTIKGALQAWVEHFYRVTERTW